MKSIFPSDLNHHQEVHFMAEDEEVIIVPNFSLPQVRLLFGCPLSALLYSEYERLPLY